jgi:flagellar motor component MotA
MGFVAGLFVALISLVAAVAHLNHEARNFWDFVAFACVTGGTLAVGLMTLPWQYRRQIFRSLFALLYR